MEINYIILAHKNPSQLLRLITRLQGRDINFYIHLDKNIAQAPFEDILPRNHNIYFLDDQLRHFGTWGDLNIVKATINAFQLVVSQGRKGYFIVMSGQDYPIKGPGELKEFLENSYGTNFLDLFSLPFNGWKLGGFDRINYYKINRSSKRGDFLLLPTIFELNFYNTGTVKNIRFLVKTGNYSSLLKIFKKRKFPEYLKPYGGSQWMALPFETVQFLLKFLEEHPEYLPYHKYTLLPDEILIQSIIGSEFSNIAPSLTYTNWKRKNVSLPVTFQKNDFSEIRSAGKQAKFFARKFEVNLDAEILDLIDSILLKKTGINLREN